MAAVRGQALVWPGFLYLPVSHSAYGCHLMKHDKHDVLIRKR